MPTKPRSKLPEFLVTVRGQDGSLRSFTQKANDLEEAAEIAAKRCSLQRAVVPQRTTGVKGEPGWFYPRGNNPKWPFAGNGYKVEPVAVTVLHEKGAENGR